MCADFQSDINPARRGPEADILLDAAWARIQEDQGLDQKTQFSITANTETKFSLSWKTPTGDSADFESAQFQIDGPNLSIFVYIKNIGQADFEYARKGEKTLSDFLSSLNIERDPYKEDFTTPEDLRDAYIGFRTVLPPDWIDDQDPMAKRALLYREDLIPPSLEIPEGALLSDGQKQLLIELMNAGEELLFFASDKGTELENKNSLLKEGGLERLLDDVHISYQLACERGSIMDERIKLLESIQEQLILLMSIGPEPAEDPNIDPQQSGVLGDLFLAWDEKYADNPKLERDQFEITVAIAKARAVLEGVPMRVVPSDEDKTWADLAVHSIYKKVDEECIRYIIKPPAEVFSALKSRSGR